MGAVYGYAAAMRTLIVLLSLLVTAMVRANERPDIIVFVSDDHRADVLGCAGHPVIRTPNLDALAAAGTRFSEAYVTTSICAASRASILTGLTERSHRFTFGMPPLSRSHCMASYPRQLRESGYRTGFVGKLGVSVEGGAETVDAMFDSYTPLMRAPYFKEQPDGSLRHVTDLTGDAAIDFIRTAPRDAPYCLSVSFNAGHAEDGDKDAHYPYPATEADLYADVPMPRPRLDGGASYDEQPDFLKSSLNRERYFWRWDTPEKYDRNLRNYFRMLSGLDRNIGRVLEALEARGTRDNTVVIFLGDNGYYMGERGFAGKWSHYEESLRVPFIVHDPRVPFGKVSREFALNIDVAPTVLDLAGLSPGDGDEGRTLMPVVRGKALLGRSGFYCEHRMVHGKLPRWEGYRSRTSKYVRYLDVTEGGEFFYVFPDDPDERVNRIDDPALADEVQAARTRCAELSARYAEEE